MSVGSIYKIVFPNGKHYIGLTSRSLEHRQKEHRYCVKSGDTKLVYNALRKYDMVDTFELVEIDTADTLEELCEKEIGYIQEYNSYYMDGNGYNMTYGGEGCNGYIHTQEDKQRQSERQKKHFEENPEENEKMKKISQDFWNKPDSIEKMSELRKKYYEDNPEAREKMSEAQKKRFENPEAREKCSKSQKERMENPEARQKIGDGLKEYYKNNPDAIQKNSEALTKYNKEHPEAGKKHSEKMKQRYIDNPEEKEKMRERRKQYFIDNPDAGKEHGEMMKQYHIDNPEEKEKMSERGKAVWKRPEHKTKILDAKGKNNPFDVFTKDGIFIKTFTYQLDARKYLQEEHNITSTIKIGAVLNGNRNSSAGFVFKYK